MIVKYFAYYRADVGCKEENFPLASLSAIDLLHEICKKYGKNMEDKLLCDHGNEIHPDVIFLIDGRNIDFMNGKNSMINESATVSLFPRIAGG